MYVLRVCNYPYYVRTCSNKGDWQLALSSYSTRRTSAVDDGRGGRGVGGGKANALKYVEWVYDKNKIERNEYV